MAPRARRPARDRILALAADAPPEHFRDPAALRQMLQAHTLPHLYSHRLQAIQATRDPDDVLELTITPSSVRDGYAFKVRPREAYPDLVMAPDDAFGLAVRFCTDAGELLCVSTTGMPRDTRVNATPGTIISRPTWLRDQRVPCVDLACQFVATLTATLPASERAVFYETVLPRIYSDPALAGVRQSGGLVEVMVCNGTQVSVHSAARDGAGHTLRTEYAVLFGHTSPGTSFGAVIHIGDGTHVTSQGELALPHLPWTPAEATAWFRAWYAAGTRGLPTPCPPSPEGCCRACGERGKVLKRCGRCGGVQYCSVTCQRTDWRRRHKLECGAPSSHEYFSLS
jgi:hypothetical protein